MTAKTNRDITYYNPRCNCGGTIKKGTPVKHVRKGNWSGWVVIHRADAPFMSPLDWRYSFVDVPADAVTPEIQEIPVPASPTAQQPNVVRAQLDALGITFSDCVQAFGDPATDPHVQAARSRYHREGEIEIDDTAVVSRGDDAGAYVMAWVWVTHTAAKQFGFNPATTSKEDGNGSSAPT